MEYDKEDWLRIALFVPFGLVLIGHSSLPVLSDLVLKSSYVNFGNYLDLVCRGVEFVVGIFLVLYGFLRDSVEGFFENLLDEAKKIF